MKLEEFESKKRILILGYGIEGQATLRFLKKFYPEKEYVIADRKLNKNYLEMQADCDFAIKSPGINKRLVKIPYTTATNIFFSNVSGRTIGVTGTKGKSTTVSLIYAILKKAKKKAHLVGNIGNPMLGELLTVCQKNKIKTVFDFIEFRRSIREDIYVCELSSYQLDDIEKSPNISVILNLYGDHMDYHGNLEEYWQAKLNIARFSNKGDSFVYNPGFTKLCELTKEIKARAITFSPGIDFLIGEHNRSNAGAATAVAEILDIDAKIITKAIATFKPLRHRLEFIGKFKDILFYDDAISTTPESTVAAITALENVDTIFLGGLNRGYDFSELAKTIQASKIENIVFFPNSGEQIEEAIFKNNEKKYKTLRTMDMREAVEFAFKNTKKTGICLLSTASPSYSIWKNFEEKGDKFRAAIESWTSR